MTDRTKTESMSHDTGQDNTSDDNMWYSIPHRPLYLLICFIAFVFNIIRHDKLVDVYPKTQLHHYEGMMAYDNLKSFTTNESVSLFSVKRNLGCVGSINDDYFKRLTASQPGVDYLLNDAYYAKFWTANKQQKFVDPAHKTVCSCIDELYYLSFLNESDVTAKILDPKLQLFITNMNTWWTTNEANPELAVKEVKEWVMPNGKYGGSGFANIAQNYESNDMLQLGSYCPSREEKNLRDICDHKDNSEKANCLGIKPYQDSTTKTLNNKFKFECRRRRDAEILQTCVRHSVPLYVMKYDENPAYSVNSVLYGQNMLVLFIIMSLIRATLDSIFMGKLEHTYMEGYFCGFLVVFAGLIQIVSLVYLFDETKHVAGENDALMIILVILNIAIFLPLLFITYASHIFSTHKAQNHGLEVHWNLWTVILFQVIIDIPLISGFVFLGSGLLMQYGVQEYLSIITVRGIFLTLGFIAHISHVLKHLQYRFDESFKFNKIGKANVHSSQEGLNVMDIFNWLTNTRLFASIVVVLGGFILFFTAKEDSLNGASVVELNQRQYMYLCITFVIVNVGYEFYHEARSYYLLYVNETLKDKHLDQVSGTFYKMPQYGDGTSAKAFIIIVFLVISHLMAFSLYWKT